MRAAAGVKLEEGYAAEERLAELRDMYEPYVNALAEYLCMNLLPWIVAGDPADNWQRTAWGRISRCACRGSAQADADDHF